MEFYTHPKPASEGSAIIAELFYRLLIGINCQLIINLSAQIFVAFNLFNDLTLKGDLTCKYVIYYILFVGLMGKQRLLCKQSIQSRLKSFCLEGNIFKYVLLKIWNFDYV